MILKIRNGNALQKDWIRTCLLISFALLLGECILHRQTLAQHKEENWDQVPDSIKSLAGIQFLIEQDDDLCFCWFSDLSYDPNYAQSKSRSSSAKKVRPDFPVLIFSLQSWFRGVQLNKSEGD